MENNVIRKVFPAEQENKATAEAFSHEISDFLMEQHLYRAAIKEMRTKLEILDETFQVRHDHNPIHHIEYRLKTPRSIVQKLEKRGLPPTVEAAREHLTDIAGLRVICNYVDDVYRVAELLLKQDDITLVRARNYIDHPKENGYRSLHLVLSIPIFLAEKTEHVSVEVQIRTIAMDFWASLEHQLKYKSNESISQELRDRLKRCADSISALDLEMESIHKELQQKKAIAEFRSDVIEENAE